MTPPEPVFTPGELDYLAAQPLGRLATAQPDGTLQISPVAFYHHPDRQTIDIGGHGMAASQKFRNVRANGRVALVVDDVASVQPWRVRCLEIRGRGEALVDPTDSAARLPGAIIRIYALRIISWGIDPPGLGRGSRNVPGPPPGR
ncbi:PPOX class F420-dependent oxidoreductase [Plantactinospora solaniradicis]|uniref:PPOX class F420-dependent oxidoreductase n=1 Tax=Plantactinospora solaniradicis TaxID=1723736 RepID=A0ABW1KFZ5_9ACTN